MNDRGAFVDCTVVPSTVRVSVEEQGGVFIVDQMVVLDDDPGEDAIAFANLHRRLACRGGQRRRNFDGISWRRREDEGEWE